jgi:putative selenate reductase molybdopterin-binding subunit
MKSTETTKQKISLVVNNQKTSVEISPNETLLQVLRDRLSLTGTKEGCGTGECGACIVLLNQRPVNSCLTLAMECDGASVLTVEGLEPERQKMHPLQESFVKHGAVQCGFCSPGMLMSAKGLLDHHSHPSRNNIKEALVGNLCRCTGYKKIVNAVEAVAYDKPFPKNDEESNIGRNYFRKDAIEHVKGLSVFGADITRPRQAFGKILRSKYAHARIKRIDTTKAEKLEGVLAVVIGKDIQQGYFGVDIKDRLVFAVDKVRYRGDALAAVAAESEDIASRACALIEVEYEPLEAVFDVETAMRSDAPLIHERLDTYECGFKTEKRGNICTMATIKVGDLEKGFSESDIVLEESYSTQFQHQCSIETHAAVAEVADDGKITVWSTTQKPFAMRRYLALGLKIPMQKINVIATKIGGGFGGKLELIVEPFAVVLAKKCGRPVKIVFSREEEFLATTPRHKTIFWIKSGVKKDGTIVAKHVKFIYDTGAYSGNGPTTVTLSSQLCTGLYRVPNLFTEGYCVYTNKMNCGSMRGPSGPQTTFAVESHMDSLAKKIGMDPLDFRLKNLLENGEKTGFGQTLVDTDFKEIVKKAAETFGWKKIPKKKNWGKGMACTYWLSGGWSTAATVKINENGSVSLLTGAVDMGTGYLHTSVVQLAAEELGVRAEDVELVMGDTNNSNYDHGIGGSRGVFTIGKAAQMAAAEAKKELFREAAERLKVRPDCLETKNGWIYLKGNPKLGVSFAEISFDRTVREGGPIFGTSSYLPQMDDIDESRVEGLSFPAFKGNTISCHMALIQVIPESGHVDIKKYVAAHDVGKAINPFGVEGQIEGGVSMGLGLALTEKYVMDERGGVVNANFRDYRIPTALDVPEVEPVIVEIPAAYGPHGAKGLGEPTMAPPAGTVANAIYDAIGVKMHQTPMDPESVLKAIEKKGKA